MRKEQNCNYDNLRQDYYVELMEKRQEFDSLTKKINSELSDIFDSNNYKEYEESLQINAQEFADNDRFEKLMKSNNKLKDLFSYILYSAKTTLQCLENYFLSSVRKNKQKIESLGEDIPKFYKFFLKISSLLNITFSLSSLLTLICFCLFCILMFIGILPIFIILAIIFLFKLLALFILFPLITIVYPFKKIFGTKNSGTKTNRNYYRKLYDKLFNNKKFKKETEEEKQIRLHSELCIEEKENELPFKKTLSNKILLGFNSLFLTSIKKFIRYSSTTKLDDLIKKKYGEIKRNISPLVLKRNRLLKEIKNNVFKTNKKVRKDIAKNKIKSKTKEEQEKINNLRNKIRDFKSKSKNLFIEKENTEERKVIKYAKLAIEEKDEEKRNKLVDKFKLKDTVELIKYSKLTKEQKINTINWINFEDKVDRGEYKELYEEFSSKKQAPKIEKTENLLINKETKMIEENKKEEEVVDYGLKSKSSKDLEDKAEEKKLISINKNTKENKEIEKDFDAIFGEDGQEKTTWANKIEKSNNQKNKSIDGHSI